MSFRFSGFSGLVLAATLGLPPGVSNQEQGPSAGEDPLPSRSIANCRALSLSATNLLGPGEPLFGHVQGLEVSEDFFFITSQTAGDKGAALYIYERNGEEKRAPLYSYDLLNIAQSEASACAPAATADLNHPSGIHLNENLLDIALGRSQNGGPSCLMTLNVADISSPVLIWSAVVEDHIGAVVRMASGALAGFNWDSEDYWWIEREVQTRVPAAELIGGKREEKLYAQDCDREGEIVICAHASRRNNNLVKLYPVSQFGSPGPLLRPTTIEVPALGSKHGGTREGLAWHLGRLFLLPDDGDSRGVAVYELECAQETDFEVGRGLNRRDR